MSEVFAAINGHRLTSLRLCVPNLGPWHAECDLIDDAQVAGAVTLAVGELQLRGTVVEGGTFGLQRKVRVVAGAGGWGRVVPAKDYHNDAKLKARNVADDAAREVGERIGTFVPADERVGYDYVRQQGPAAQALIDVIGGVAWWVDYDGATNVGPRPAVAPAAGSYEVLAYDPRERIVTLAVDDPRAIGIGSLLSARLDVPQTVRELEVVVGEELRVTAWTGGGELGPGRVAGLLQSITETAIRRRLYGKYRYRVVRTAGDRVELQARSTRAGLPNVLPVSMWPGIAGAHAELTPGVEVLVEFIEGDRLQPIVTGFAGKGEQGFVPVSLTLGGDAGAPCARSGDAVEVLLPPAIFSGTIGGVPATGVLTFPMIKTLGVITAGSSKVKVAS
jgi:hypothetical protein